MGAAPVFVNASAPQTGATQNMVVNMPASIVAGNLLLVFVKQSQQATACTGPAGWNAATGLNSSNHLSVWYRWADGSEAASYTFSAPSLQTIQDGVSIQVSGGIKSGQPFNIVTTGRDIAGSTSTVALSVVTTIANTLLVYVDAKNAASRTLVTPPTGMTSQIGPTTTFHVFTEQRAAVGSSGSKQAVMGGGNTFHLDGLFAITPATEGNFTGSYDFTGSGFTGDAPVVPPSEGTFTGGFDFAGSNFVGAAGPVSAYGFFNGGYDFTGGGFTGADDEDDLIDVYGTEGGRRRFGGRK